jgi:exopolysaccharide biosynthesis polyprenyl glycosylphosphotransferase
MARSAAARLVMSSVVRIAVDAVAVLAGFLISYEIRERVIPATFVTTSAEPLSKYLAGAIAFTLITLVVFWRLGLYQRRGSVLNLWELETALKGMVVASAIFFAALFLDQRMAYSRLIVVGAMAIGTFLVIVSRQIVSSIIQRLQVSGRMGHRVLIYGCGATGRLLMKKIVESPQLGCTVAGFLDDAAPIGREIACRISQTESEPFKAPVLGRGRQWERVIREHDINELLLSCAVSPDLRLDILQYARENDLKVGIVPHLDDQRVDDVYIEDLSAIPVLRPRSSRRQTRLFYHVAKRCFDIVAAVFLTLLTAPVWIIAAIVIPLESPGPVFFEQERIGRGGRPFRLIKFRSMWRDADPYALSPVGDRDARITRSGRVLRMLGLDELPQLLNVIRGDMSLVGPRPEMPFIVEHYSALQRQRLEAKPGITGPWQISADRHAAIHDNLEYDLYYLRHQSLALDALILLETAFFTCGLAFSALKRIKRRPADANATAEAVQTGSFLLVALDQRRRDGVPPTWSRLVPAVCRAAQLLPVRVLVAPDNVARFDELLYNTTREGRAEYELYTSQTHLYSLVRSAGLVLTDLPHVVRWAEKAGIGVFAIENDGVRWIAGAEDVSGSVDILTAIFSPGLATEPEVRAEAVDGDHRPAPRHARLQHQSFELQSDRRFSGS